MAEPRTILVYVGLDLVGDGLIKLPFVRALRAAFPAAHVTWLAGKGRSVYAGSLAPAVGGLIDEVIEDAGIGSRWAELFRRPLGGRSFDLVIDTQRRLATTLIVRRIRHRRFVSGAAGHALSDARPPRRQPRRAAMIRQMLDLVELASLQPAAAGAPLRLDAALLAEARLLLPDGPVHVGLAPGAGGAHKRWPLERFIALARLQARRGRVPVFILGPDEQELHEALAAAVPEARFPLQAPCADGQPPAGGPLLTIALATRLAAAVANDSGGGHMLAAAATPLVSLFGPTDPAKFAPWCPRLAVVRAQHFGGSRMDAIPLAAVADAVEAMLSGDG